MTSQHVRRSNACLVLLLAGLVLVLGVAPLCAGGRVRPRKEVGYD